MVGPFELNLRHLFMIPKIDRAGGITAACEVVNLSQPALTQGLANLETMLGCSLFDRENSGARATLHGRLLIQRIERALGLLREAGRSFGGVGAAVIERRVSMGHLRAIVSISDYGGFSPATRATGLAQPALHRSARELEQIMGQSLFIRSGRNIQLTQPATRLVHFVKLALSELRSGLAEIEALQTEGAGRIVIGAMPLARATLIPRVLALFHATHQSATVSIIDGPYPELLHGLRDGEIDLLLGALRDPPPATDILQLPLFEDQVAIVCRRDHPLAKVGKPGGAQLSMYPWVISRKDTPLRSYWENLFVSQGCDVPSINVECSSVMAIRGLLLSGDWLTLLSPAQIQVEKRAGLLVEIGNPLPNAGRWIGMTTRKSWHMTAAQRTIVDLFKEITLHKNQ